MKIVGILNRQENPKEIDDYYVRAVKGCGAIPLLLDEYNMELLELCGGILLTGGDNKGKLDDFLIEYCLKNQLPLLGICQGMQSMALYHTKGKLVNVCNHYQKKHEIYLRQSRLKQILDKEKIMVNSYHHQQVINSKEFKVSAYSSDHVIEAVESENHPFQIGVEWHPERMMSQESSKLIFQEFIKQIRQSD